MGAPFWSEDEKQYFIDHIVPRSHYANGYYESNGRSFDDLAPTMQRDLDERGLSRRTYNGDLLFQHWYQKVRPTVNTMASSSAQRPAPLPTISQQVGTQAPADAGQQASSPSPVSDNNQLSDTSEQYVTQDSEPAMAEPIPARAASSAQDKSETPDQVSSPAGSGGASELPHSTISIADTPMELDSAPALPSRAPNSPPTVPVSAPARPRKKRTLKAAAGKGEAAKKPRRAKKSTPHVLDSDSDNEREHDITAVPRAANLPNPRNATEITHSGVPLRRFSPPSLLASHFEADESPYHLRHPIPMPGDSSSLSAARGLYSHANNPYPSARPGPVGSTSSFRPRGAAGPPPSRRPASHITPFTQDDGEIARLQHRHAVELASGAHPSGGYRGHVTVPAEAQPSGSGSTAGAGTAQGGPRRVDAVTGQRLGEVTLQGTTLMTYCPSCQRPF
jgi:hypothetical protein